MHITIVSFIIGFMLFVQYNTVQNPTIRDTKDIWEIRSELAEEQKTHSELLNSIRSVNETISKYEDDDLTSPQQILEDTVDELQIQIGEKSVSGPGLIIDIEPSKEVVYFGYEVESIPPMLLIRLINELNRNNAAYIEIGGERITLWSAIRDINSETTINGQVLGKASTQIKVITQTEEQAQRLYNYLLASTISDNFYIDNLNFHVNEVEENLTIETTNDAFKNAFLEKNE